MDTLLGWGLSWSPAQELWDKALLKAGGKEWGSIMGVLPPVQASFYSIEGSPGPPAPGTAARAQPGKQSHKLGRTVFDQGFITHSSSYLGL